MTGRHFFSIAHTSFSLVSLGWTGRGQGRRREGEKTLTNARQSAGSVNRSVVQIQVRPRIVD